MSNLIWFLFGFTTGALVGVLILIQGFISRMSGRIGAVEVSKKEMEKIIKEDK